jgi:hypothetical protein
MHIGGINVLLSVIFPPAYRAKLHRVWSF